MNKPICIYVDEPEACVLLSKHDMFQYRYVLPIVIENLVFCILNDLFISGIDVPIDSRRVTWLLCTNVIYNNPTVGLSIPDSLNRLINPLFEVVNILIPELRQLDKFSALAKLTMNDNCVSLTFRTLN